METVLITGANKGIGFEVARQLGARGIHVFLGSRDATRGSAAVEKLHRDGIENAELLELDVTDQASIEAAARKIRERDGKLDVLINNAGIAIERAHPSESDLKLLRQTFETNFFGAVAVTQAFLPLLRKSENPRIVNVSSSLGSLTFLSDSESGYGKYNFSAYSNSKTALNAFSVLLANELRPSGIKVNAVCPGYTATDLNDHQGTQTLEEGAEAIVKLATAGPDSLTGAYIDRKGTVPW